MAALTVAPAPAYVFNSTNGASLRDSHIKQVERRHAHPVILCLYEVRKEHESGFNNIGHSPVCLHRRSHTMIKCRQWHLQAQPTITNAHTHMRQQSRATNDHHQLRLSHRIVTLFSSNVERPPRIHKPLSVQSATPRCASIAATTLAVYAINGPYTQ
jgi:hypothetical protein